MKIAHIVNLFSATEPEDILAQSLATQSMSNAAHRSRSTVELLAITDLADAAIVTPQRFRVRPVLTRNAVTMGFASVPPLPLINDIILAGLNQTDADIIVYTNSDIIVCPDFYSRCEESIAHTPTSEIRRYTVDGNVRTLKEVFACKNIDRHPGADCFVMRREAIDNFVWNDAILGVPFVTRGLALNCAMAGCTTYFGPRWTFHIGDSRRWQSESYKPMRYFNRDSTIELAKRISVKDYAEVCIRNTLLKRLSEKVYAK